MKSNTVYESHISTAKWLIYDVPGNIGWIMYIVCLIQCFLKQSALMQTPPVRISLMVGILPAIAMAVGIVELISERILKLDRILPKKRVYRGFGALTWGGCGGMIVGLSALFASLRSGYSMEECQPMMLLAVGGALCGLFAGLIFKTFHPQDKGDRTV